MRFSFLFIFLFLYGCNNVEISKKEHSLYWQKNSAEYVALSYQAYNLAEFRLDEKLNSEFNKRPAIVIDLDETVLNNLPYNEMLIDSSEVFTQESWSKWVNKKIAAKIPGSLEFINYAKSKNVKIIYLSNRRVENYDPTKENLVSLGYPFDEDTLMLLRDETGDKTTRRSTLNDYEIIMLLGDNLADFSSVFYKKSNNERIQSVDSLSKMFGDKFIIFPNLIYGDWEDGFKN
jgi:5'-nucleotidase (lipoprotein e(P4) family)